ncbi:MAG TPA: molybdenum cofactor biosynthesis protein [Candidatus Bathyarchaeota archaeon]|nr:molybdenum cofactor biosynthesis protein [Candidatus Bathyarchaeota archaeon]
MKPFTELLNLDAALRKIIERVRPVTETERIRLEEALGRVLAEDVESPIDVPPFSRAAMDGYAVRAEDTYKASRENPCILKVIGKVETGGIWKGKIEEDECVEISTGAPIPMGADAVVMVEYTKREGDEVKVFRPIYPGGNVSERGTDIKRGEKILTIGSELKPSSIGVLAAIGRKEIIVYRKPRVAVISTGYEIRRPGEELRPGEIYDINSYTLSSVIELNGGIPIRLGIVEDNEERLEEAIRRGLEADMVVLSGGSSVGSRDLLRNVLERMGEILFHGIQVKPGKPTLAALIENKIVLAMPGYPTSCLSNAYLILRPILRRVARLPPSRDLKIKAVMGERYVPSLGRRTFLTVSLRDGKVYPVFKESGAITSMSRADGFIVIPENRDLVEEGETVEVYLF